MTERKLCHKCEGTGKVKSPIEVIYRDKVEADYEFKHCETCNGKGYLEVPKQETQTYIPK